MLRPRPQPRRRPLPQRRPAGRWACSGVTRGELVAMNGVRSGALVAMSGARSGAEVAKPHNKSSSGTHRSTTARRAHNSASSEAFALCRSRSSHSGSPLPMSTSPIGRLGSGAFRRRVRPAPLVCARKRRRGDRVSLSQCGNLWCRSAELGQQRPNYDVGDMSAVAPRATARRAK
jgi:hypothetical protein